MPEAGLKESLRFYAKALKMPTFAHIEDPVVPARAEPRSIHSPALEAGI